MQVKAKIRQTTEQRKKLEVKNDATHKRGMLAKMGVFKSSEDRR